MAAPQELRIHLREIIRTTPVLNLATVNLEGRPHSSTLWTAPRTDLGRMYWLSSPHRVHSQDIDSHQAAGRPALVSGGLHAPQRPSRAVVGLSFEGVASRIIDSNEVEEGMEALLGNKVFFLDEAKGYLRPSEGADMATHQMYGADVTEWTVFDGRARSYKNRVRRYQWPPALNKS